METGHFILEILLLVLVICLGFAYSEEVSSNRALRGQLKKLDTETYWLKSLRADYGQVFTGQEAEIALKNEKIIELEGKVSKLTWDYNLQADSCKCSKETRNDSKIDICPVCPECLGEGTIINNYGGHTEEVDCPRCAVPTGFSGNGED